jgi:radical SAM superfamily enzyme YgiQ (UPF0313 family)
MRKKLLLIQPVIREYKGKPNVGFPAEPMALQIIAGLTPKDWEIKIIDERMDTRTDILESEEADLVGLTSYTSTAPRAYEIASFYRKKGIPVVMGGAHATIMPQEVLEYVDTVVTGEAEGIWGTVIADFEAKNMQRIYNGLRSDLNKRPTPRRDVIPADYKYPALTIQIGRGCPHNCDFCSVTILNGSRRRRFPLEETLDELEAIPHKVVVFLDDNMIGYSKKDKEYAIKLLQGINERGINKIMIAQTSLYVAQDDILRYAEKSGIKMLSVGIEAEDIDALKQMNKTLNLKLVNNAKYEDLFSLIHQHGMSVDAGFIYGLDTDTPEKLRKRTDFIINSGVDIGRISPLTPLPGTRLFERMRKERRLLYTNFPEDWKLYDLQHIVFKPALMKPEELDIITAESKGLIFSKEVIEKKYKQTLKATCNMIAYMSKSFNTTYRGALQLFQPEYYN